MQDWYQMPALVLTTLLLPGFGQLYWRTRDVRSLMWFLAFLFVVVRMFLLYPTVNVDFLDSSSPWTVAAGQSCAMISAALFLASLSPLSFRIGRFKILFVIPFTIPLVAYALLAHGIFHLATPHGAWFALFSALGLMSIIAGLFWAVSKGTLPPSLGVLVCALFGGMAIGLYFRNGLYWPLILAESGCHLLMALLILSVFRRISAGVAISVAGFSVWALPILLVFSYFHQPALNLFLMRAILMAKVAAALGLLLLALENELAVNRAAGERERRVRREMEAYAALSLQRRRVEDFDHQAHEICATIVEQSRFSQAALLLIQPTGFYSLAGAAGIDGAVVRALGALAIRIPVTGFLDPGFAPLAVNHSQTLQLDLRPWFLPGDDLDHLHFTSVLAVPMPGRSAMEGALLVAGLRGSENLRADDLVPLEILAARIQAVRSQTRMLEKLIDAEKFAGLGQLAGNVFVQLNNPLTVILGYASLLEESPLDLQARRGVDAILNSARSMRSTLESLQRVTRSPGGQLTAVSVAELLGDMERLHRSEFLQRGIEFRLSVPDDLPRMLCQPQQLRQAILHCLQFSMDALDRMETESERTIRLEATYDGGHIQIVIAHTGPAFDDPERAFDPFAAARSGTAETGGLGLSLCATILRDNHGRASAVNLAPGGAAILLDLGAA